METQDSGCFVTLARMKQLSGKHILLGVTGGIAACKSADLVRHLRQAGAEVRVVMTRAAAQFVTPLTFQTLSGYPVLTELLDSETESALGHIDLARWADAILVAPATANTIARLSHGLADDLLAAVCLASSVPLALAPAMNQQMWCNPATQSNIIRLKGRGVHLFGPADGDQACGESGPGRMLEPDELVEQLAGLFTPGYLTGIRVMVTAGPTLEDIDPVRYLGNRSSGKMGYAVAEAALEAGADVILVSGVTCLDRPDRIKCIDVRSAIEMRDAVMREVGQCDIFIAAAAVADYRPVRSSKQKIKKDHSHLEIKLELNPDILIEVINMDEAPYCVGFAAETECVADHARAKLAAKKMDMVAANLVGQSGSGFESDKNALEVFWDNGGTTISLASKSVVARRLIELIAHRYSFSTPSR